MNRIEIRHAEVTRYIKPLREGGSLPAIVQADDDFLYVLKFRGAGQGKKALIAELIGGLLAQTIGLNVPELVFLHLDNSFSRTEPDEEIQDLLKFSVGLNLGLHFLSGAITYDPLVSNVDSTTASKVVILDSLIMNIDRTAKNTNLLKWNNELWLIDHGASLYFHHKWENWKSSIAKPLPNIRDHVLLERADNIIDATIEIRQLLNKDKVEEIVSLIPNDWLEGEPGSFSPDQMKIAYAEFLCKRLDLLDSLVKDVSNGR